MSKLVAHLTAGMGGDVRPKFLSLDRMGEVSAMRIAGFADACAIHGVPFDPERDVVEFASIDDVSRARVKAASEGANVLMCVNDILAAVVLSELERIGVKVPEEMAVAGFDYSPLRRLTRPLLTTVALPVHDLARFAGVRLQAEIVENEEATPLLRVAGDLVIGDSTRSVPSQG
jgi:LacI family transcriptional regulator